MAGLLLDDDWLETLVTTELARHEPEAAIARLPPEIVAAGTAPSDLAPAARLLVARSLRSHLEAGARDQTRAFLHEVDLHVGLALDLGALRRAAFTRALRRAEIAAFLAGAAGAHDLALAACPGAKGLPRERAVRRALVAAGELLRSRFHPPGDPIRGLPLHPGTLAIFRRRLSRVAMSYLRDGSLDPTALGRHADYAARESALLAEALSGFLRAAGPPDPGTLALRTRQVARLGLPPSKARDARRAVSAPRAPEAIAATSPEPVRPFLVEQLHLAQLRTRPAGGQAARFLEDFVAAAGLHPEAVVAARIEAAAQHGDHQLWFQALGQSVPGENLAGLDWQAVADQWGYAADAAVERVSAAVADNLDAIMTEIRETGELGQLLAKAAAGKTLSAEEKRKVRGQLVDLAKAVPALAIFAAPGGMLLLPLLAKLLPFPILPSAFERNGARRDEKTPRVPGPEKDRAGGG